MILTDAQMDLAVRVGKLRTASGLGLKDYLHCEQAPSGLSDIQAAIAECAMALYTGLPWRAYKSAPEHLGMGACQTPDVGPIEVKSISRPHHKLILHSKPMMEAPHARLLVVKNEVTFTGWAFGFEIWSDKYWDKSLPTPAYARSELYGIKSLCDWCRQSGWDLRQVKYPVFEKGWEPK